MDKKEFFTKLEKIITRLDRTKEIAQDLKFKYFDYEKPPGFKGTQDEYRKLVLNNQELGMKESYTNSSFTYGYNTPLPGILLECLSKTEDPLVQKLSQTYNLIKDERDLTESNKILDLALRIVSRRLTEEEYNQALKKY